MNDERELIGERFPLDVVTKTDSDTGVTYHRFVHRSPSQEQIFYYCNPAITADGRHIPCWSNVSGRWQIHVIDRENECSRQLSGLGPEFADIDGHCSDVPCLSREYNRVFYHDRRNIYWTSLDGQEHEWMFRAPDNTFITFLSARGRYLVFSYIEHMNAPELPNQQIPRQPQLYYRPRSVVFAIDIETGAGEYLWGQRDYIAHVQMCPFDDNVIMFANQSLESWQQEIYVVEREHVDDKRAKPVLAGNFPDYRGRTMDYIGHCFFTQDGYIGGQYSEMGGVTPDNHHTDRTEFNLVIRPDGIGKRKAKFPGQQRPCHVHCQTSTGLWVGDHWNEPDGTFRTDFMSVMVNDFACQEVRAEPLIRVQHYMSRPWHIHPWMADGDESVICALNTGSKDGKLHEGNADDNHMTLIEIPAAMRERLHSTIRSSKT